MKSGLLKVYPSPADFSLIHSFGATPADVQSLPDSFSIYDGRPIPNQDDLDFRFNPPLSPLFYGCTAETGSFETGLQDGTLYNPQDLYDHTPPFTEDQGRDIRTMLEVLITRGVKNTQGILSPKRLAYFNCYGAGAIDDFDAARIGIYLNQAERRGVYIGSYFYPEFVIPVNGSGEATAHPDHSGIVPTPSFNTSQASLHCYLATGWKTIDGVEYLECLTWQGQYVLYFSRAIFNALMAQPYTGAFTITKLTGTAPVPIGIQAIIDHVVYYVRTLFRV